LSLRDKQIIGQKHIFLLLTKANRKLFRERDVVGTPVKPALRKWRQGDLKFGVSLGYIVSETVLKKQTTPYPKSEEKKFNVRLLLIHGNLQITLKSTYSSNRNFLCVFFICQTEVIKILREITESTKGNKIY
jgi:hypothetical protein